MTTNRGRRADLGVDWYLPGRKRRFATTTPATSLLVSVVADDGRTWSQVRDAILYDPDAAAVAQRFVDAGYGDTVASTMLTR